MKILLILTIILSLSYSKLVTYKDIEVLITKECHRYPNKKINKHLIRAMIFYESKIPGEEEIFDTKALSKKNCRGLMQISEIALEHYNNIMRKYNNPTIRWGDIYDIDNNITVGIWLINNYLRSAKDNLTDALIRYVGGSSYYASKVLEKEIEYKCLNN